jgi:hypothetical protein
MAPDVLDVGHGEELQVEGVDTFTGAGGIAAGEPLEAVAAGRVDEAQPRVLLARKPEGVTNEATEARHLSVV